MQHLQTLQKKKVTAFKNSINRFTEHHEYYGNFDKLYNWPRVSIKGHDRTELLDYDWCLKLAHSSWNIVF